MGLHSTNTIQDGNCNNTTTNYGTFYLNLNNDATNTNWNIGTSFLILFKLKNNVLCII